jgi:hypothetical protein
MEVVVIIIYMAFQRLVYSVPLCSSRLSDVCVMERIEIWNFHGCESVICGLLDCDSILKMEVVYLSEMLVTDCKTACCYNQGDHTVDF